MRYTRYGDLIWNHMIDMYLQERRSLLSVVRTGNENNARLSSGVHLERCVERLSRANKGNTYDDLYHDPHWHD